MELFSRRVNEKGSSIKLSSFLNIVVKGTLILARKNRNSDTLVFALTDTTNNANEQDDYNKLENYVSVIAMKILKINIWYELLADLMKC